MRLGDPQNPYIVYRQYIATENLSMLGMLKRPTTKKMEEPLGTMLRHCVATPHAIMQGLACVWIRYGDTPVAHAAGVALAALATAWNSRANGFVWDDRAAILGNSDTDASQSQWWELFQHDFWGYAINTATSHKSYRPLTVLTFRYDRSWHGLDPSGFHFTNVLLHALCSVLVWCTACVVLDTSARQCWGALLAGVLFAVHPIHCDSVASIVGRADILCVIFSLSGYLAYVVAETRDSWVYVVISVCLGACACLCKELGITVFGIYVAHTITKCVASSPSFRHINRGSLCRMVCVVACTIGLLLVRLWVNGEQTKATFNGLANSINVQERRLVRLMSYAHIHAWYLWKLVWPSWFSYDYGFNTVPVITDITDSRNMLTAMAYAIVIMGVVKGLYDIKRSPLLLCIAFGVIPFVPASNVFFPVGTMVAERLLYFPSVGFCLLVGLAADHFEATLVRLKRSLSSTTETSPLSLLFRLRPQRFAFVLVVFILSASMCKSINRNAEWNSEETLFIAAVEVVPENVKVLNNAAKVMLNKQPDQALQFARRSAAMVQGHVESQTNLGLAFTYTPMALLAIRHMIKAVSFSSTDTSGAGYAGVQMYNYWLEAYNETFSVERAMRSRTVKFALRFLDTAITRRSPTPAHYYQRGLISEHLNDLPTALRYLEEASRMNDRIARLGVDREMLLERGALHNRIACIRRNMGRLDEALAELLTGIELYPTEATLYFNIASIYITREQLDQAAAILERCLLVCTDANLLRDGARLLQRLGQQNAARVFFERAASLLATS